MQKETVVRIVAEIKANYRYTYRDMTKEEMRLMVERWYECLKPFSDDAVEDAFRVALCKFSVPPTLADIISIISRQERLGKPSDRELWTQLQKSILDARGTVWDSRLGFCEHFRLKDKEAQKAYAALDALIQAYIDFDGFCDLCGMTDENMIYERNRFLKVLPELREAFEERKFMQMQVFDKKQIGFGIGLLTGGGGN